MEIILYIEIIKGRVKKSCSFRTRRAGGKISGGNIRLLFRFGLGREVGRKKKK